MFDFKSTIPEQREKEYKGPAQLSDISFDSHQDYFDRLKELLRDNEEVFYILTEHYILSIIVREKD